MTNAQYGRLVAEFRGAVGDSGVAAWANRLTEVSKEADSVYSKLMREGIGKCRDGKWRERSKECRIPSPEDCR